MEVIKTIFDACWAAINEQKNEALQNSTELDVVFFGTKLNSPERGKNGHKVLKQ